MGSARTGSEAALRVVGGRFQLLQLVGEGAFAHVYRARELTNGREVAVKVLKETLRADAEVTERFRREVFAVASIDSPHVVRMFDFGVSGDEMFIAMEYVEGPILRDLLGRRPLSPDSAHIVVGQVAQALAAAHETGILHRDLKPENVILVRGSRGRQVKVLDFGLAKLADLEQQLALSKLTKEGMCFGTPQYMSPEQINGQSADRRSDLWSLAVMAYEIVSGRLPWDGEGARDIFYAILSRPLPPITSAHRSLKRLAEVNRFFASALSLEADERPPDAAALFGGFEQALFGGPHAPAGRVFSGIVSAEFALTVDDTATTEPGDGAVDPAELEVTESTVPGKARSGGARKLRSEWLGVGPIPELSETRPGEAPRLEPPPVVAPTARAVDAPEKLDDTAPSLAALDFDDAPPRKDAPSSAATPPSATPPSATPPAPKEQHHPATATVARPASDSRGGALLALILLALMLVAAVIGYVVGHVRAH